MEKIRQAQSPDAGEGMRVYSVMIEKSDTEGTDLYQNYYVVRY